MSIQVQVLLFARAREIAGTDRVLLALDDGATLGDAAAALSRSVPALADYLGHCRLAMDREFCDLDDGVRDGAELAVIPPVSGGI